MRISRRYIERSYPVHDWLSNLPTDILHHILSFLDITEVVKTSMFSRKWRYIWHSVPCINFDFRDFWNQQQRRLALSYNGCLFNFWVFVKRTFRIRFRDATPIYKLQFFCDYFDGYQLEFLYRLCVGSVQELYINAGYGRQQCPINCALPDHIGAVSLNLKYIPGLKPLTGFRNLKTVHLVGVQFPDADIAEKLLGDCGVLESLSLESCCFTMIKFLNISANKLKKLNFVNHGHDWWGHMCMFDGELELHSPNLASFCYSGPVIRLSDSSDILSLKNVSVLLRRHYDRKVPSVDVGAMVSGLHRVEKLSVSAFLVLNLSPAFRRSGRNITPFDHLRCLKLDLECKADHMEGLIKLLQLSSNLETLRIQLVRSWMISGWKSRAVDVPCLSRNLEEIEIVAFRDSLASLELIKFFLQNGKSLERIKILLKGKKANPQKFYALHEVQLASEAVSVSIASTSASGEKELIHILYGKRGVSVQTKTNRSMIGIRRSIRIAAKKSGSSS